MHLPDDPIAIVSSACRLPLGITSPSQLWDAFCGKFNSREVFTSPKSVPESRHSDPSAFIDPARVGGAGWLGSEGIELFDATFFNISPAEAEVLRPNTRLALELTWEALERAGIPPASVRGKNVAVSIGVGTEDGWDLRRFSEDRSEAFDHRWAANSDPSGVSGQVAHYFDFRGPSSVISTACSSGAFALRDGNWVFGIASFLLNWLSGHFQVFRLSLARSAILQSWGQSRHIFLLLRSVGQLP